MYLYDGSEFCNLEPGVPCSSASALPQRPQEGPQRAWCFHCEELFPRPWKGSSRVTELAGGLYNSDVPPALDRGCGLPAPWCWMVRGEQLLRAFPVWRAHPCLVHALSVLACLTSFRCSWALRSGFLSVWLRAGLCEASPGECEGVLPQAAHGWSVEPPLWSPGSGPQFRQLGVLFCAHVRREDRLPVSWDAGKGHVGRLSPYSEGLPLSLPGGQP